MQTAAVLDIMVRANTAQGIAGLKKTNNELQKVDKQTKKSEGRLTAIGRTGHRSFGLLATGAKAGGLAIGVTLVAGLKKAHDEAREAAKVGRQTAAVLKSTGGAANVSAKQIEGLANSIAVKSGMDDEAIQSAENLLLTFTKVRNETGKGNNIFSQATQTITDMSVALDQDLKSSTIQVGKALNDPIKGITALQRVGVSFTAKQKEMVAGWVNSGQTLKAQKFILAELKTEFGGSAAAQADGLDKAKAAANNLLEVVGGPITSALSTAGGAFANFAVQVQNGTGAGGRFRTVLVSAFNDVKATVMGFVNGLNISRADLQSFAQAASNAFQAVRTVARAVWPGISQMIRGVLNTIVGVVKVFSGILTGDFKQVWNGLKQIVAGSLQKVLGLIKASPFGQVAKIAFNAIKKPATDAFGAVRNIVSSVFNRIKKIMGDVIAGILRRFATLFDVAAKIPGIGGKFRDLADKARGAADKIDKVGEATDRVNGKKAKVDVTVGVHWPKVLKDAFPAFSGGGKKGSGWPLSEAIGAVVKKSGQARVNKLGFEDFMGGTPFGAIGTAKGSLGKYEALGHRFGLQTTSAYRPGDPGWHGKNRARDLSNGSGPTAQMMAYARFMAKNFGGSLLELIYSPLGFCVPHDTLILTRRGWLTHEQVVAGDETVGYNPETGCSEWTAIREVQHFGAHPLVEVKSKAYRFRCTPNHRWATERRTRERGGVAVRQRVREMTETCELTSEHRIIASAPIDESQVSLLTAQEAAIVGWLVTDGHVGRNWPRGNVISATIYQKKQPQVDNIRMLLADVPHSERSHRRDDRMMEFRIESGWVQALLDRVGDDLEQLVMRLSGEARAAMFDAMFAAEGSTTVTGQRTFSQNEGPVLEAFVLLAYLLGERPSRFRTPPRPNCRAHQVVTLAKRDVGGVGTGLHQQPAGVEPVWCVTTDLGTWTAQQQGVVTLTGNSIKNGKRVPPYARADHYDHVHVAAQRGAMVPGSGSGDKVRALLEPGEGIINKKAVRAMGGRGAIDALNAMVPRFQGGGVIGTFANQVRRSGLKGRKAAVIYEAMLRANAVEAGSLGANPRRGDRDSLGVFQIRGMHGPANKRMDPKWSANWFIRNARSMYRNGMSAAQLAALVERPAAQFRGRYGDPRFVPVKRIRQLVEAFQAGEGPGKKKRTKKQQRLLGQKGLGTDPYGRPISGGKPVQTLAQQLGITKGIGNQFIDMGGGIRQSVGKGIPFTPQKVPRGQETDGPGEAAAAAEDPRVALAEAILAQAAASKELQASLDANTAVANSTLGISNREITRYLADIFAGQLGTMAAQRMATPSTGALARY